MPSLRQSSITARRRTSTRESRTARQRVIHSARTRLQDLENQRQRRELEEHLTVFRVHLNELTNRLQLADDLKNRNFRRYREITQEFLDAEHGNTNNQNEILPRVEEAGQIFDASRTAYNILNTRVINFASNIRLLEESLALLNSEAYALNRVGQGKKRKHNTRKKGKRN